jgi:FlaA1/EpsC-like NDP-sugar epimerase
LLLFFIGDIRYFWSAKETFFDGFYLFPISVLVMEFFVSLFLLVGFRFFIKLIYLESIKSKEYSEKVLIYGAGVSGLITKRTIEKDPRISYQIVGFIDDNKKLRGTRLEGLTIYHSSKLPQIIVEEEVSQLIVAIQKPKESNKKKIVEIC